MNIENMTRQELNARYSILSDYIRELSEKQEEAMAEIKLIKSKLVGGKNDKNTGES